MTKFRLKTLKHLVRQHLLLALLLTFLLIGGLWVAATSYKKQKAVIIPSTGSAITQPTRVISVPGQDNTDTNSSNNASPKNTTSNATGGVTAGDLSAPSGTFVSTHSPTSSATEESYCNTSPGASCYIQFTNGSTVKKLEARTAGSTGSVYWIWKVSDAGLSAGSWEISAFATLNGQTKSTKDQILLKVTL